MDKYEGHTPGPWRVDEEPHETGFNHVSIKWDNWTIASVLVSGDESMTNAKLIANAPLLAERVELLTTIAIAKDEEIEELAEQNAKMLERLKHHCNLCESRLLDGEFPDNFSKITPEELGCVPCATYHLIAEIEVSNDPRQ